MSERKEHQLDKQLTRAVSVQDKTETEHSPGQQVKVQLGFGKGQRLPKVLFISSGLFWRIQKDNQLVSSHICTHVCIHAVLPGFLFLSVQLWFILEDISASVIIDAFPPAYLLFSPWREVTILPSRFSYLSSIKTVPLFCSKIILLSYIKIIYICVFWPLGEN